MRVARLAAALLSGLFLILCFPKPHLSFLAPVALLPLLLAIIGQPRRGWLFLYGYATGVVFLAGTMYWIYSVMLTFGSLSTPVAASVLVLFVLVFALFFGLYSWWVGEIARRDRTAALLLAPAVWVAMEFLRTHLITGVPWNLLGYALAQHPELIQSAAYTGVYGISFLLAAVNAALAAAWFLRRRRALWLVPAIVILVALLATRLRLPAVEPTEQALLVQTNLPQLTSFEPDWARRHQQRMQELYRLTAQAAAEHNPPPTLVLWPEVPAPLYFHHDSALRAQLMALAQTTQAHLLVGIVDYRKDSQGRDHPYNSAVMLAPSGELVGQYDKIHLVPFGEYVPWSRVLRFAGRLVAEVSDFAPGTSKTLLPTGSGRATVVICYEAIFPGLVRSLVARGADLLVNISNDGWFGESAAPAQHFNMARVRAVETRRYLLRATNTGITAVIDPFGRVVARTAEHERTALAAGFAPQRERTFYVRYGDWFAWLCLVVGVAALARTLWLNAVEARTDGDV
ncbi:MAG: apolipoprotein N-acyltransferase [Acidobacteria bacterium]|nr:apolipoprotein N-acyltransferase [Acidobacteriota bacterium]